MSPLLLILTFTLSCHAAFVEHLSDKEYNLNIEENGVRFTQKVTVDTENGLVITQVPDHHNIAAATFIFQEATGLMLDVIPKVESCHIHRPFMALDSRRQQGILESLSGQMSFQDEKYTTLSPNNTLELSFVKVMGPEILLAELPSDIAKYCPSNYTVYLTRQVQVTKEALSQKQMSLDDPLAKKELKFGDPVPDFKELFDILPPSALRRLSRAKRECRSPDGQTVYDNCSFANIECDVGCPITSVVYDCENQVYNCQYILLCPVVGPSKDCVAHIRDGAYGCRPCCKIRNCGRHVPECRF